MEKTAATSQHPAATLSKDHAVSLILTFLIAETSVLYTCYWAGHTEGVRESGGMLADLPYTLNGLHIVISICLGLSFVGLWLRRGWGLIVSSLALVSILATYGYWHFMTVKYLSDLRSNQELYRRMQQEVGFFLGATKWDLVVLVLVALLLVWQLVKQIKMTVDRRRSGNGLRKL